MLVEELIGGPVQVCGRDLPLVEAAEVMIAEDIGSLAVTHNGGEDGDLVGIFTERDVVRALAKGSTDSSVGDWMTGAPDSLALDVDVGDAIDWMMGAGYRHLPVIDRGRLVGMLSIKDLLWAATEADRD